MWWRLIVLGLMATPVAAQSPIAEVVCVPREQLLARLKGADLAGAGLRDTETVVEVWTRTSGDWVLVQSYPNGLACILAMGEAWEAEVSPPA
ncbi:hypothetical protein [Tabrizicola sp.]|uniref:hypothetical protein n=1 Tax=Tabrizicola sp. TaxID=2005166 RepID=UPI00261483B4|nr:hypothetical protein [Tabrizicola sp.]MDM7932069.1 hypothetical protein [Tabrizicola sp.]